MAYPTMMRPELAEFYRSSGQWLNKTVFDVLTERATAHPSREVFADARIRLTYAELRDKVERCAAYFKSIGIGEGDVITIQLPNRVEYPIVFFALELIGAVANTVNPDFRSRELDYILKFSNSRGIICASEFRGFDYLQMIRELQKGNPKLTHVIISGDAAEMHDLDKGILAASPLPVTERVRIPVDEVYRMAFTSGTTGNPKCAIHSFNTSLVAAQQLNHDMAVTDADVQLIYLPVGLNWGYLCLLQILLAGCRAVLMERFSARPSLEAIQREKITYVATAPASIVAMLNVEDLASFDTSSLRVVVTGGAAAAIETIKGFQKHFKAHLIELFGMLETGFPAYTRLTDDVEKVNGTIGRVAGHMKIRLVDAEDNEAPFGGIGELSILGPSVCLGYLNNSDANAQAFNDKGWFRSGDLGRYVDEDRNIQLTGRSKEIINRGGKKFFPREVEEILYTHPKILHAAMIGLPDPRLGEKNCLCVVLKGLETLALSEVVAFLKGQVADYKLPEVLYVLEELPMTGTGKVRRPILQEQVAGIETAPAKL
jgi:non-ribosomal peptide synthetase component E (peptide arylation enzyme)